ncbi:ParB/RepB/Spo0J family partition protein [Geomicrobium sediminis]|uniref:ParB/RepB/Spo0J family partition protein n=1 Tax=Geomicrobium sediminis TaxID=1347788 RepID=A0ABS2PI32_9BACL|nr:ParB N-terminal domain-containing protein [Geomicrobium sediminis]MBM7634937.1 ParB/RepB/Spo0J family partition protein [Geomicrobium sediminis]
MTKNHQLETVSIDALTTAHYQVWSDMPSETFAKLKEDIAQHGIIYPIIVDENYVILDGHHRYKASQEVGLTELLVKLYFDLTEDEKLEIAHKMNTTTRELSRKEKIERARKLRSENRSYRQIAQWLGVGKSTVERWINDEGVPRGTKTAKSSDTKQQRESEDHLRLIRENERLKRELDTVTRSYNEQKSKLRSLEDEREFYRKYSMFGSHDKGIKIFAHFVGLDETANVEQVDKAFRKAKGRAHPDAGGSTWASARYNSGHDLFKRIYKGGAA